MKGLDEKDIEKETKEKTIVMFRADWCPFCRKFRPDFESYEGKVKVKLSEAVLNQDENPLWDKYDVKVVPTIIAFKGGKEIGRRNGKAMIGLSKNDMDSLLKEVA
jgi:thioredoxin 1